jgi:nitrogen fixation protein FixH
VAFFVAVMAVNFVMAYKAITTHSGVDTPDAYRTGLAYNTRIAAEERQGALGWTSEIAWATTTGPIHLKLVDRGGAAVTGLHVTAKVQRPATDRFDHTLVMTERAPGVYEVNVPKVDLGNWAVEISAAKPKRDGFETVYETRRRVWLKQ